MDRQVFEYQRIINQYALAAKKKRMSKKYPFKVGDVVRKTHSSCGSVEPGETYTVWDDRKDPAVENLAIGRSQDACHCKDEWELVTSKTNTMSTIIDKIKLATKAEPNKTLITRGLLNMDETLTAEGRTLLEYILVQKYGDDMSKAISSVPVDEKKN